MEEQKGGLLLVLAHPDDESMDTGGLILRHTRNGISAHVICATYGEAGWIGKPPGAKEEHLRDIRTRELEDAAFALALDGVELWDYADGGVATADPQQITQRIWEEVSKLRPRVVVGWGPDGGYGHPDNVALGACTDAAVSAMTEGDRPALYHIAIDQQVAEFYREATQLGSGNHALPAEPLNSADVVIELEPDEVMMKLRAIDCHRSQLADWRIALREHPHLMQKGYGHEPYVTVSSRSNGLTERGLLGEFA